MFCRADASPLGISRFILALQRAINALRASSWLLILGEEELTQSSFHISVFAGKVSLERDSLETEPTRTVIERRRITPANQLDGRERDYRLGHNRAGHAKCIAHYSVGGSKLPRE
jgi:hypothetical protein